MSDPDLHGHHALITGAGSGIGRASAEALARAGADVTLVGRSEAALAETARLLRHRGRRVTVAPADVRDAESVRRAFAHGDASATIDLLVTSAGRNHPGPLTEAPVETLDAMLQTNVLGTLLACQAFGQRLLPTSIPGAVVCVSSQMGAVGYPGRATYCATKHAVNGLTKALALEWARHPIRVNAVAPTFVETPLTEPMLADPHFHAEVVSRIPLGRLGTVEEVTDAILYLLSDQASLITGHVLAVDGGWTVM